MTSTTPRPTPGRLAAPLLTPRSAGVSFVLNGRIVYAGGECKDPQMGTTFNEAEVYDPAAE